MSVDRVVVVAGEREKARGVGLRGRNGASVVDSGGQNHSDLPLENGPGGATARCSGAVGGVGLRGRRGTYVDIGWRWSTGSCSEGDAASWYGVHAEERFGDVYVHA